MIDLIIENLDLLIQKILNIQNKEELTKIQNKLIFLFERCIKVVILIIIIVIVVKRRRNRQWEEEYTVPFSGINEKMRSDVHHDRLLWLFHSYHNTLFWHSFPVLCSYPGSYRNKCCPAISIQILLYNPETTLH